MIFQTVFCSDCVISIRYSINPYERLVINFVTQTKTGKVVFISHLKRISYQKQKVKGFRASCMTNYVFLEYEILKFCEAFQRHLLIIEIKVSSY